VDNLWLCVTITLGMALVIGLAQPFAQPQINVLQSACFGCAWPWGTLVIGFTPDSVLTVDDWQGHVPEFACHKSQSGQANQASLVETQCKLSRSFFCRDYCPRDDLIKHVGDQGHHGHAIPLNHPENSHASLSKPFSDVPRSR